MPLIDYLTRSTGGGFGCDAHEEAGQRFGLVSLHEMQGPVTVAQESPNPNMQSRSHARSPIPSVPA
jgi:hypothetical protein